MQIQFLDAQNASAPRLFVHLVNQDSLPGGLNPVLRGGAPVAKFTGKAGQVFDGFVSQDGGVTRVALVGLGAPDAGDRDEAAEKAGAAISARFLHAGEGELTITFADAGLSAQQAAALLLAARLRAWRFDAYRTKLPEDQQPTLKTIMVRGAHRKARPPRGTTCRRGGRRRRVHPLAGHRAGQRDLSRKASSRAARSAWRAPA